nr:Rpn family recombination-promoting nuclease/putative transposase [Mycoavidus sp. B2-EB]
MQAVDKSYVTAELREVHSDMVYACQINGKAGYIPLLLLLEHQSTADNIGRVILSVSFVHW